MSFGQCFMCREFSSDAISRNGTMGVRLCHPCWDEVVQESFRKVSQLDLFSKAAGGRQSASEPLRERPDTSVPLLHPQGW